MAARKTNDPIHLWNVTVSFYGMSRTARNIWITTPTRSMVDAIAQTEAVAKKRSKDPDYAWENPLIEEIEYSGTIAA